MKAPTEEEKFWLSFDLVTEEIIESFAICAKYLLRIA